MGATLATSTQYNLTDSRPLAEASGKFVLSVNKRSSMKKEINVTALRKSMELLHCLQKERAITCGLMISKGGDIKMESLDPDSMQHNKNEKEPLISAYLFYQHMTDAAVEVLKENDEIELKDIGQYIHILGMSRLVLADEDSLEELKEESSGSGFALVLLSGTFQSSLLHFNKLIRTLVDAYVFEYEGFPELSEEANLKYLPEFYFDLKNGISKNFGKLAVSVSALMKACFTSLRQIHIFASRLLKQEITIGKVPRNQKANFLNFDVERRIGSLYALLVMIVHLKEAFQIEILFLQHLVVSSCNSSKVNQDYNRVFISFLKLHYDYQKIIFDAIDTVAENVDASTFKNGHYIISTLMKDALRIDETLAAMQEFINDEDDEFLMHGIQKFVTHNDFIQLAIAHIDKLHAIELSIIEQIQCSQLSPDRVQLSRSQRQSNRLSDASVVNGKHKTSSYQFKKDNGLSNMTSTEIKNMLESMSPELMKSTLMTLLDVDGVGNGTNGHNISVEDSENEEDPSLPLDLVSLVNEWKVDLEELNFKKKIGTGGGGTIYLSSWRRENVAVKVAAATALGMMSWKKELRFLKNCHHPNVIRMLGCVYSDDPFAMVIVLEYCDKGNLSALLTKSTPKNFFLTASLGLANGVSYLHHKGIMHRDIKPENILVHGNLESGEFALKIIDFGLSVFFDPDKYGTVLRRGSLAEPKEYKTKEEDNTAEAGTYRWMAPEIIRHEPYNFRCDIYSYAIVVWQLLTREKPYADLEQHEAAAMVASKNQRPPLPKGTPKEVVKLIEECWAENSADRPMMNDVCERIDRWKVKSIFNKTDISWLNSSNGHPVYGTGRRSSKVFRRSSKWSDKGRRSIHSKKSKEMDDNLNHSFRRVSV